MFISAGIMVLGVFRAVELGGSMLPANADVDRRRGLFI